MEYAVVFVLLMLLVLLIAYARKSNDFIDLKLMAFFTDVELLVHSFHFPAYRFVDLFKAIEHLEKAGAAELLCVSSAHAVKLHSIIHNPENLGGVYGIPREINQASKSMRSVDVEREESFPTDTFWVWFYKRHNIIIRLREDLVYNQESSGNPVLLELAAASEEILQEVKQQLMTWSLEHSIYRGKVLDVLFEAEVSEEYGRIHTPQVLSLAFQRFSKVDGSDIILDPEVELMLAHNVFDFYQHQDVLRALKVPLQRGLLLYGPPGTGKTYTCRYIVSQMNQLTTFLISGDTLRHIDDICSLARLYQPSLIVMEDVDLMFASREINLYSSALGDFMDQLDGLHKDDAVTFIMTTNAIERLEEAIKDRPGRISQCIYMGPPNEALRGRYINYFLSRYDDVEGVGVDISLPELVSLSRESSQAFIKELVFRAMQFASKENGYVLEGTVVRNEHFVEAHRELTANNTLQAQSIVGFRNR